MLALGWSFYRRQQFKRAPEPGCTSRSVPLPGKYMPALRTRLGFALVALSFAGLTLLLGPQPHALAASASPQIQTSLGIDQYLSTNQYLVAASDQMSSGGNYFAIMQSDGNFVVYKGSGPSDNQGVVWATNTNIPGQPPSNYFAIMQGDGNFCVYHGSGPSDNLGALWCTRTNGSGATQARLEPDGNFIITGPTATINPPPPMWPNYSLSFTSYCPEPIVWSSLPVINSTYYCWQ